MSTILSLILMLQPAMSREDAAKHAAAIVRAADEHHLDAQLLLAIAYAETRLQPTRVSRAGGGWFCGVMQVKVKDHAACDALSDVEAGYLEGAARLGAWMKIARGNAGAALRGYGCGFEPHTQRPRDVCRGYDTKVLKMTKTFRRTDAMKGHEAT